MTCPECGGTGKLTESLICCPVCGGTGGRVSPGDLQEAARISDANLRRQRNLNGAKDVSFKMCRRVADAQKNCPAILELDWNAIEDCAGCGTPVIYDRRDSEGKAHICIPCAWWLRQKGFRALDALDAGPDQTLSDEEHLAKITTSMAQHKLGESGRKPIERPEVSTAGDGRS